MQDARIGPMLQPRPTLAIRHDTDSGARLDAAEMRPVLEHAKGIGDGIAGRERYRRGQGRIAALLTEQCGAGADTEHDGGDSGQTGRVSSWWHTFLLEIVRRGRRYWSAVGRDFSPLNRNF